MSGTVATPAPPAAAPPAPPPAGAGKVLAYALASFVFGLTQGLGSNFVTGNLQAAQGQFGATTTEVAWLSAAYSATSVTASFLLYKFRAQYGVRLFARIGLALFVAVSIANLLAVDLRSAIAVRLVSGFAAAPLSSLAFLYMLEVVPMEKRLTLGVPFGLLGAQVAVPLARIVSTPLILGGGWEALDVLELGLALVCFALVHLMPITPPPRAQAFDRWDALSYPLLAAGLALLCVALTLGRLEWWFERAWIGTALALGIGLLALVLAIELNRARPMLHLGFLSSYEMLTFAGSMLVARFVLAEQTTGALGFLQNLGLLNEHVTGLLWVMVGATAAGVCCVAFVNRPENAPRIHLIAFALVALAAWLESRVTSLWRPEQFYLTQAMISFAGAIFLPSALSWSFGHVVRSGMGFLPSFFAVFLASQNIGALMGSATLGTFVQVRERFHAARLAEGLTLADPLVADRVRQYGAAYARVLPDAGLRSAEGVVSLGGMAAREAWTRAYADLFLLVSVSAALILAALLLHMLRQSWRARAAARAATA